MEKLYSVPAAAAALGGISKWTIYSWFSKGKLRRIKIGGRVMVAESELRKIIEDGGNSPPSRRKCGAG